ncbi:hypothetical protein [Novosphingobium naphthalenivorans]|uniref:hypothetical protein n=1 Tax=Novosphingobium naphthalenivorans TaxID=273168 RepID=UPI0012ECEEF3|nr:hypothetical protein [Novosphingobium naphthalenivorans]
MGFIDHGCDHGGQPLCFSDWGEDPLQCQGRLVTGAAGFLKKKGLSFVPMALRLPRWEKNSKPAFGGFYAFGLLVFVKYRSTHKYFNILILNNEILKDIAFLQSIYRSVPCAGSGVAGSALLQLSGMVFSSNLFDLQRASGWLAG